MAISDGLLAELDHEVQSTRRHLERVPADKLDFKPHPKSMTLGDLASHIAQIPSWGSATLDGPDFDVVTGPWTPFKGKSGAEMAAKFDETVGKMRASLKGYSDEKMFQPWSLKRSGQAIFTLPRAAVMRSFVFSHLIHHRAQLGVYLRMVGVDVPSAYGPTADEGQM